MTDNYKDDVFLTTVRFAISQHHCRENTSDEENILKCIIMGIVLNLHLLKKV